MYSQCFKKILWVIFASLYHLKQQQMSTDEINRIKSIKTTEISLIHTSYSSAWWIEEAHIRFGRKKTIHGNQFNLHGKLQVLKYTMAPSVCLIFTYKLYLKYANDDLCVHKHNRPDGIWNSPHMVPEISHRCSRKRCRFLHIKFCKKMLKNILCS